MTHQEIRKIYRKIKVIAVGIFIGILILIYIFLTSIPGGLNIGLKKDTGELSKVYQLTPWVKYGDDVVPHQSAVFCGEMNKGMHSKHHCWVVTK